MAGRTGSEQHRRTAGLAENNIETRNQFCVIITASRHAWAGACRKKKGVRSVTRVFGRHLPPATRPHTPHRELPQQPHIIGILAARAAAHHGSLLLLGIFLAFAAPGDGDFARLCLVATNETFAATHKNM